MRLEGRIGLFYASFVAGALSGGLAALSTHPFDLVKTRRQIEMYTSTSSSSSLSFAVDDTKNRARISTSSTRAVLESIVKEEGEKLFMCVFMC